MEYNSVGSLTVSTFAADSALPISNALVRVYGIDEENKGVEYSDLTDIDGKSRLFLLPTQRKEYSLEPGAKEKAYASYDVHVERAGYADKLLRDVAVFEGVTTALIVNMIPRGESNLTDLNLESVSLENPNLE